MRTIAFALAGALLLGSAVSAAAGDEAKQRVDTPEEIARAQQLGEMLDASNKLETKSAIEQLGTLRSNGARDLLIAYIERSKNAEWSTYAIRALGWKGNAEAVDFLCGKDGVRAKNVLVAEAACGALVSIGDKRAIPTLIEATKHKKDVVVRAAITAVVTLDRDAEGLADLMVKLAKRKESQVREAVADAMASLTDERVIDPLIEMATRDGNSLVRLTACRSLGRLRAAKAREALQKVAEDDKSMDVRAAAMEALGNIPAPKEEGAE